VVAAVAEVEASRGDSALSRPVEHRAHRRGRFYARTGS
jgi:hypothetical protein